MAILLQHVYGYMPREQVPEHAWKTLSEHPTYEEALRARFQFRDQVFSDPEMAIHKSRARLFNTGSAIQVRETLPCLGPAYYEFMDLSAVARPDNCAKSAVVEWTLPAHAPCPAMPIPPGWYIHTSCGACHRIDMRNWDRHLNDPAFDFTRGQRIDR